MYFHPIVALLTAVIRRRGNSQGWEANKEVKLITNILLQSPTSNDFDVNKINCSFENKPWPKKGGEGQGIKKSQYTWVNVTHRKRVFHTADE